MVEIGETIYIIFRDSINKEKVYLLGKESFCHERAFNNGFVQDYKMPLRYDWEGTVWFKTLNEAKEQLKKTTNCSKIKKYDDDYWEAS